MKKPGRPLCLDPRARPVATESETMDRLNFEAGLLVKRAMRASGWTYADLATALRAMGVRRSATVINRRINRGNFSAGFLLACLAAMGQELRLRSATPRETTDRTE